MNIHSYELNYELKTIRDTMQSKGIINYPIWITETNPWRELIPNNNAQITSNFLCNWIQDTLIPYFNPQVICWFNLRNFNTCVPTVCNICDSTCTAYGLLNSLYQPLVLSAFNACYDQLTSSVSEITGKPTSLLVYPNPFSSATVLQTDKPLHYITLEVINILGQRVAQIKNIRGQTVTFSRDNLPSGLYFIWLKQDNKVIATQKIIITD